MYLTQNKMVVCADGFSMSVQANQGAYCSPRLDRQKEYSQVEVGFPSQEESLLMPYCENPNDPTETVYGWVPVNIVTDIIAKHGGIVEGDVPAGVNPGPRVKRIGAVEYREWGC